MRKDNKNFSSIEEFSEYLAGFKIPIDLWGKGEAKEVSHLLREIQ